LAIHFYYAFARSSEKEAKNNDTNPGLSDVQKRGILKSQTLSQREAEVLLWTARGKSASSISIILGLSENTVNFYVKNAMRKLGTTNRVVAVVLAVRLGLIQP
jgi:LuxR family quorum-sensing system transcriptional regulator CciR